MFNYDMFINKMQRVCEGKIKCVAYGTWYGNTIMCIVIYLFLFDFLNFIGAKISMDLFLFLYLLSLFILVIYLSTRKAGIAITDKRITFVKFRHIGYREKEIHEILEDKIRSITCRKIINTNIVNISYISNIGKLEKVRFIYSSFILAPGSKKFSAGAKEVREYLTSLQKVIDKGDF